MCSIWVRRQVKNGIQKEGKEMGTQNCCYNQNHYNKKEVAPKEKVTYYPNDADVAENGKKGGSIGEDAKGIAREKDDA
jgi:hypothetical protein